MITSENRYRHLFESSHDMVCVTSKHGAIIDINQAGVDLLGYGNKQEVLALPSAEKIYLNPMHYRVYQKEMARYGYVKDFEARFKKKDGTAIHCLISGNAIKSEDGQILGYESIIKDVTARMDAVRDLQKRYRELSLLNSVSLVMNRTQNIDEILGTALQKVLEVLILKSGAIFLIDQGASEFKLCVQQGLPHGFDVNAGGVRLHDTILMQALLKENLMLTPKLTFPPFGVTLTCGQQAKSQELDCFLITAKEKACGFIALDIPPKKNLNEQDYHLLGSLGNFLGGAIEKSYLLATIQKHREELKRLTARLFHSQETERKRIARELHDEAGQALTGIHFSLETLEERLCSDPQNVQHMMVEIKQQVNRSYRELRRISHRLHPSILSDLGLEPALDAYLSNIAKHRGLKTSLQMAGFEKRLDPELETVLFRLSQETLTNTLKHARARIFKLTIIKSYPNIIFVAEDDGVGFNSEHTDKRFHSLGILSMQERAAMSGGTFSLRSAPGKGTRIRIEIPFKTSLNECVEDSHAIRVGI